MGRFQKGVHYYTTGVMTVTVFFPEDEATCFHCWLRDRDTIGRAVCRAMQNRELYYIQEGRHEDCPLELQMNGDGRKADESVSGAE